MRITKRRLKQIIREEYSALKKQRLASRRRAPLYESRLKRIIRQLIQETALDDPQFEYEEEVDLNDDDIEDLGIRLHMKALKKKKSSGSGKDMR